MREIKFRVWDKENKKMDYNPYVYGEYTDWGEGESNGERMYINDILKGIKYLMQYTGLHDKNGKEIYESDILQSEELVLFFDDFKREKVNRKVEWKEELGMYHPLLGDHEKYEVIGNIYENPELLKENK